MAVETNICPVCQSEFTRQKGQSRTYCSRKCQAKMKPPPRKKPFERVVKSCRGCGKEFHLLAKIAKRRKYCSAACASRSTGKYRAGTNHWNWNGRCYRPVTPKPPRQPIPPKKSKVYPPRICESCGGEFVHPWNGTRKHQRFCSRKCGTKKGPEHPAWKGVNARRSATVRDVIKQAVAEVGRCEKCASTDDLHGHHKQPLRSHPELAADRSNIEVLCSLCHSKEHPESAALLRGGYNLRKRLREQHS